MAYTPAETAILNEIKARLENITVANEYNNEFKKIVRGQMEPFKGYDLPAVNYYKPTTEVEKTPYGKNKNLMSVVVEVHSKTRDDYFVDVADSLAADVATGLFRATTAPKVSDTESIALGGTVQTITYLGHSPFIGPGEKPFCGTLIRFEILFESNIGDMENYS